MHTSSTGLHNDRKSVSASLPVSREGGAGPVLDVVGVGREGLDTELYPCREQEEVCDDGPWVEDHIGWREGDDEERNGPCE